VEAAASIPLQERLRLDHGVTLKLLDAYSRGNDAASERR